MEDIKVYKMNDCEWWASKLNREDTNNFYNKEYHGDNELYEVEECDIDNSCMWTETLNQEDIDALGDSDEIRKGGIGDLMRRDSSIFKMVTFREALGDYKEYIEPFMLATTEW